MPGKQASRLRRRWCMTKFSAWLTVAIFALGICLASSSPPAHAAEDSITNLTVHYDIQADATVRVEHAMDWRFAAKGRHGIDFSIVTREMWDADATRDVVYDVSNISVFSPSGAPVQFTERTGGYGSDERIELRIGDGDVALQGREASYIISYEVRGGLRTLDDVPEFHWDVTSRSNPGIENFEVRVSAPEGVTRARCLQGTKECDASVSPDGAVMRGQDLPSGTVLSVVAALPAGSVSDAEPHLEAHRIISPALQEVASVVEVLPTGLTHVEQEFTYRLPWNHTSSRPSTYFDIPVRRPYSATEDQHYVITDLTVGGADEVTVLPPRDSAVKESFQDMRVEVDFQQVSETTVVVLSYDVAGAVSADDVTASLNWFVTPTNLYDVPRVDFKWRFPVQVQRASCVTIFEHTEERRNCGMDLAVDNHIVSWAGGGDDRTRGMTSAAWVTADLDPLGMSASAPLLEPSLDAAATRTKIWSGVVAGAVALIFLGGTVLGTGAMRTSRRWADVAPGNTAPTGSATRPVRRDDNVPVRFDEPDCSLVMAGLVLDQHPSPRHTAATLVQLATIGAIRLQSSPLTVTCVSDADLPESLERTLYEIASTTASGTVLPQRLQQAVVDRQEELLRNRDLFEDPKFLKRRRRWLLWVPGLVAFAALLVPWLGIPGWLGPHGGWIVLGAFAGGIVGGVLTLRVPLRVPLAPGGTALRDQVVGLRTYIASAEANQLNFEANADIYGRYLPWAVLFDLTERWTRTWQSMVSAGRIPELDTSFWGGTGSPGSMASDFSLLAGNLPSVSSVLSSPSSSSYSSDGSGGSSGFSSDSSGGGGGGGTSSSSW